jgi:hypothetical protein
MMTKIFYVLGYVSIVGSIVIWFTMGGKDPIMQAHAERFGIFVGLWAPTFFVLSNHSALLPEKTL